MIDQIYSNRVVAFIDLLGFSQYIDDSSHDEIKASAVFKLINAIENKILYGEESEMSVECENDRRVLTVSDSIVISYPLSQNPTYEEYWNILAEILHLQVFLMKNGWLSRGGISSGKLYQDGNKIFGEAYNCAYRLESTTARVPRVVVDCAVVKNCSNLIGSFLLQDPADGQYFINFLYLLKRHTSECGTLSWLVGEIDKYRSHETLGVKYQWLEDYFRKTYNIID